MISFIISFVDDYVAMSSTKEMIKEIIPNSFLGQGRIRVFSPELKKTLPALPLLLINGVPAKDKEILNLPPDEIKYVEVVYNIGKLASFGSYALGGIFSVITKNDFEFGPHVNKIEVSGFVPKKNLVNPERESVKPFFPSDLYWNPDFSLQNSSNVEFDLPAHKAKILVNALFQLTNGTVVSHEEIINLKDVYEE